VKKEKCKSPGTPNSLVPIGPLALDEPINQTLAPSLLQSLRFSCPIQFIGRKDPK
jgi:hypothetical protein